MELAWGRDERGVITETIDKSIGNETTFTNDSDDPEFLLAQLLALSEQVARRMRRHGMQGSTVVLKLRFSDFKTVTRSKKLPAPIDTAHELYGAIKTLFEAMRTQRMRVRLVGVRMENLIPVEDAWAQLELGQPELRWRDAERAIDRATDRFGSGSVKPARLVRPDDNY